MKVLVISRQPLLAEWLIDDLKELQIESYYAQTAREAWLFINKYSADVIVSGHLLDDGNGISLFKVLKEQLKEAMPPFILWTGIFFSQADASNLLKLGMSGCFDKGNKEGLIDMLQTMGTENRAG